MRRKICIVGIVLLFVLGLGSFIWFQNPRFKISQFVNNNINELQVWTELAITGENEEDNYKGIVGQVYNLYICENDVVSEETHKMVEFEYKSSGFALVSKYYGFYYSPDDVPFAYDKLNAVPLTETAEGEWEWSSGGHNGKVIKLCDKWYYYEAVI